MQGTLGVKMGKRVSLFREVRSDISISISVYIHPEDGSLVIEGQDCGEMVMKFHGDSDYEYWVVIPALEKGKLLESLQEKGFGRRDWQLWVSDDVRLLSAVKARFGGNNDVISEIQKYCAESGIVTKFHSY